MRIDITPRIEEASDSYKTTIKFRGIDALYVVRLANGKDYTTKMSSKELEEFQPSKTVSEMISSWEANILRRYEIAKEALRTKLHPTFTVEVKLYNEVSGHKFYTGETETQPKQLDQYEKANFKRQMKDLEMEFGTMEFVKIIA
jgi:hypothetical protein